MSAERFTEHLDGYVVFADGAAKGNPGPGGWGAILVSPDGRVRELGGGDRHTTNNRMELGGVIAALQALQDTTVPVVIYTDSTYVVRGITQWLPAWRRRGWRTTEGTPVLNRELWETLSDLVTARPRGAAVSWRHVRGHSGVPGNERADEIASAFATARKATLYDGTLAAYEVPVLDLPHGEAGGRTPQPASSPRQRREGPAFSYVSLVDGRPMRHATWADCERRVKGRSGARFRKTTSAEDEAAILRAWGVAPESLGPARPGTSR
jgi:ribonuclease HI